MMILSGVVISWLLEIVIINLTHGRFVPWSGFVIIMPTIASLIANDFAREGTFPTVVTTSLAALAYGWSCKEWYFLYLKRIWNGYLLFEA